MGKLGITKNNKKWSPQEGRVVGWNAKKTGFKRGPEKKIKENGVGWLLNKNTCTYEIDLKFFWDVFRFVIKRSFSLENIPFIASTCRELWSCKVKYASL